MNASITSTFGGESPFAAVPRVRAVPEPPVHLPRLMLGLGLGVAAFDACFWEAVAQPGLSVTVFSAVLVGAILYNRERAGLTRTTGWLVALMAGALLAAAIETCVTNFLVLQILIIALAGESYFFAAGSFWGRWLSQGVALVFAPGRVIWLGGRLMEVGTKGRLGVVFSGLLLTLPAVILALVFGTLLSNGNAVFGIWAGSFFTWCWQELIKYLDLWRILSWAFVASALLPLLRPSPIEPTRWSWVESLPRFPARFPTLGAVLSSAMVLVVLNVLFLVSNIADALFLWSGHALPAGVSYKDYVHEGVEALIVTVILSAVVLAVIFQQAEPVARHRGLKLLAYFWIVQNLFLIASVTMKLWGYVETYEMTVKRLSTIIFLILVTVGFVLLTIKIVRDRSISWLIGGCVLAVFATFYITQFLDLAGWSANYNVARMEKEPTRIFDANTMSEWGADVWPALKRAHELAPEDAAIAAAWGGAKGGSDYVRRAQFDSKDWREFSLRAWWNRFSLEEKP